MTLPIYISVCTVVFPNRFLTNCWLVTVFMLPRVDRCCLQDCRASWEKANSEWLDRTVHNWKDFTQFYTRYNTQNMNVPTTFTMYCDVFSNCCICVQLAVLVAYIWYKEWWGCCYSNSKNGPDTCPVVHWSTLLKHPVSNMQLISTYFLLM